MDKLPDIDDIMSSDAFGAEAEPTDYPRLPPIPPVQVGELTFVAERPYGSPHGCNDDGHVAFGAGFYSGSDDHDLCSLCFVPDWGNRHRAPTADERVTMARLGTGGDHPLQIRVDSHADFKQLGELVDRFDVHRVIIKPSPLTTNASSRESFPDRVMLPTLAGDQQSEYMDMRTFELHLSGLAYGPPMDPDLLARIEAAKDDRGVINDPALGDEYFEAMQKQSRELERLHGREPIDDVVDAPHGSVWSTFDQPSID